MSNFEARPRAVHRTPLVIGMLGMLAMLATSAGLVAAPQSGTIEASAEAGPEYRVLATNRTSTMERELNRAAADELAGIAQDRIMQVGIAQRILSHAIQTFAARGDASNISPEQRARARPWLDKHDAIIDDTFFDALQEEFEAEPASRTGIRHNWLREVPLATARTILHQAEDSLPCPAIYRYRARVAADSLFEGRLRGKDGFPDLFTE